MHIIPLFPLQLVVFPGSYYPLHIFEERYKLLLSRCRAKGTGFGIVLPAEEGLRGIGCLVQVHRVTAEYPDGRLDIVVRGTERFRLLRSWMERDGYHSGEIELFGDKSQITEPELLAEAEEKFVSILSMANFKLEDGFWEQYATTVVKSFKMAEKSGLTIEQQQELLSMQGERERVRYLLRHYERMEAYLEKNEAVRQLIERDGYLNVF